MRKDKELSSIGYHFETTMSVDSTDRDVDELLKRFDVKSLDEITLEHPVVKERLDSLINHMKTKGETMPEGGKWHVFRGVNDCAWTYIDIGYLVFVPKTEIVRCKIKDEDGNEVFIFLKEVSAEKIADFEYFHADYSKFEGEVISSSSDVYFQLRRIEKKEAEA